MRTLAISIISVFACTTVGQAHAAVARYDCPSSLNVRDVQVVSLPSGWSQWATEAGVTHSSVTVSATSSGPRSELTCTYRYKVGGQFDSGFTINRYVNNMMCLKKGSGTNLWFECHN